MPGVAAWTQGVVLTDASAPTMGAVNRYNAASGELTVTLPALSGLNNGARLMIQKDSLDATANPVTVNTAGTDEFDDGETSFALTNSGSSYELQVLTVTATKVWKVITAVAAATAADYYYLGGTDVAVADGGTGRSTSTTAYGLLAAGTTATGAQQTLAAGATTEILVGGGASALPSWTTATGSGAPVRATSPTVTNPTITNYTESVVAIGDSGTSQTLALTNGTVQTCTLTGNCTFTMPTATAGKSFILYLKTGAGSFTAAFTSVKWPNGTAPTITTTASRMDILSFVADGTNWYGSFTQNYTP